MKQFFILMVALFCFISANAVGYKIDVKIKNVELQEIVMALYWAPNRYHHIDSTQLDKKGKATFSGDKALEPGMYLILLDGERVLDFLISDTINQTFSVEINQNKFPDVLKFKGSPENAAFVDYTKFLYEQQQKEMQLKFSAYHTNDLVSELEKQRVDKIREIHAKYPQTLLSSIVSATQTIKIVNNNFAGYKKHYWDNFPLTDSRIQNTPIFINWVNNYFTGMIPQIADSIIIEVDNLLSKVEDDTVTLKYLTDYIFSMYAASPMIGSESVMIHIIDEYYLAGKVKTDDEKYFKEIVNFANKYRSTLIGNKAKELKMETINGMYESLYDIDSPYTLVYFFEPDCGYCRQETPKVYKVFEKFKDKGLAGFCVYTQQDKKEWVSYISKNKMYEWTNVWDPKNENNFRINYSIYIVPQIYVLNKDKTIVGRGLDSERLEQLLTRLLN